MIKQAVFVIACTAITSCSSSKKSTNKQSLINLTDKDRMGMEIIKENDCFACHSFNEKLVGPPFNDIAKRYEPTKKIVMQLSKKIIAGGSGNWGRIPMTPHSALSQVDAEAIVRYIFLLKK